MNSSSVTELVRLCVTGFVSGCVGFIPVAPPAAEPAGVALVSISSNVDNCDVEIDGAFAGNTPSQLSLAPGTHKITVSQNGYTPWSKTVLVTTSGLHLRADLNTTAATPAATSATAAAAQQ